MNDIIENKFLCNFCNMIAKITDVALIISSILLFISLCLMVIFRYVFDYDIKGLDEIIVTVVAWAYFLGAAMGSYSDSHIKADVINSFVKNQYVLFICNSIKKVLELVLSFFLAYFSYDFFVFSLVQGGASNMLKIPRYISYASVLVGCFLIAFFTLISFLNYVLQFKEKILELKNPPVESNEVA